MSVASRTALAAVALLALFTIASAQRAACLESPYGQITNNEERTTVFVQPLDETRVSIYIVDECPPGTSIVGSRLTVCTINAPAISHRDLQHAVVDNVSGGPLVTAGIYCL